MQETKRNTAIVIYLEMLQWLKTHSYLHMRGKAPVLIHHQA